MDTWVWIVIAVAAIVALSAAAFAAMHPRRRAQLQKGFGAEYDRTLAEAPSRREAEAELQERQERYEEFELRPLSREARGRYRRQWQAAQARFVDDPDGAIGEADSLIEQVMSERGYPVDEFDQRAADLSVEHGDVIENYRTAHAISRRSVHGMASTEDQRQAFVQYRVLFEGLVEAGETARVDST
jgi:hypothetical protein